MDKEWQVKAAQAAGKELIAPATPKLKNAGVDKLPVLSRRRNKPKPNSPREKNNPYSEKTPWGPLEETEGTWRGGPKMERVVEHYRDVKHKRIIDEYFRCLSLGMPIKAASERVGLVYVTVHSWLTKGEIDLVEGRLTQFAWFYQKTKQYESMAMERHLVALGDRNVGKQSMRFLEARFNKDFSTRVSQELSGPNGSPIAIDKQAEENLDAILADHYKEASGGPEDPKAS